MKSTKFSCLVVLIAILLATRTSHGFRATSQVRCGYNALIMHINESKCQGWRARSLNVIKKKGAAALVATGVLIAPRIANARGARGVLDERNTNTLERDEYHTPSSVSATKKVALGFKKKAKVEVVVEDEVDDEYDGEYDDEYEDYDEEEDGAGGATTFSDADMSRKLTNIGLGAAIGTTIAVFVMGDDNNGGKKGKKTTTSTREATFRSRLDLNDLPSFERTTTLKTPMGGRLGKDVEEVLRPPVDLGEDDDESGLFKASASGDATDSATTATDTTTEEGFDNPTPQTGLAAGKFGAADEDDSDLFAPGASSPASSTATPSAASALQAAAAYPDINDSGEQADVPAPAPAPAPEAPKKKNLLSRIFGKPGAGRPTDLTVALKEEDKASFFFRSTVASALNSYVPAGIFSDFDLGTSIDSSSSEDAKASELKAQLEASGLSEQEAADAFAEVANAMLTTMTDRAAVALKDKDTEKTLLFLDDLADFVGGAGAVFGATVPGAQIEPVVYNGKTKKGQVENLYLEYLKATMSLEGMMGMMGGIMGSGDTTDPAKENEVDPEAAAKAKKAAEREEKIGRLQQAFAIKEKKRANLESKVMKDLFMNMAKGGEGMPDLGGMMDMLGGAGGGDPAAMEEMLKKMGDGAGGMPDFGSVAGMEGMPDMSGMSDAEVQAMSKDAIGAVKQSLADGSITREDVKELEKIMGMDVSSLAKMIDNGQVDKAKLAQMGPEFTEMLDLFKQLAKIK